MSIAVSACSDEGLKYGHQAWREKDNSRHIQGVKSIGLINKEE